MAERAADSIHIDAGVEEVFEVAADVGSYPQWNANIKTVEITETDDEGRPTRAWFQVDVRVRVVGYTLVYDYSQAPASFSWELVDGDVKQLSGSYTFDVADGGTDVTYELTVDPGFPVPGFIRRQAERQIMRGALDDLKKRVESR